MTENHLSYPTIIELTKDQYNALRNIIIACISEGFTTPPYPDVDYDIFEKFNIYNETVIDWQRQYDVNRPNNSSPTTMKGEDE